MNDPPNRTTCPCLLLIIDPQYTTQQHSKAYTISKQTSCKVRLRGGRYRERGFRVSPIARAETAISPRRMSTRYPDVRIRILAGARGHYHLGHYPFR